MIVRIHAPAGEDQHARHEAQIVVPPAHQDLDPARPSFQRIRLAASFGRTARFGWEPTLIGAAGIVVLRRRAGGHQFSVKREAA
jgi:hypothetical protein